MPKCRRKHPRAKQMMPTSRSTDPALVAEIGLTLLLIGLGIYLYLRPAAENMAGVQWWHWLLLTVLFFAILGIHRWRQRRLGNRALHETIAEDARRRTESE